MARMLRMEVLMPDLIKYAPLCMGDVTRLCKAVGMSPNTFKRWKAKSEDLMEEIFKYEENGGEFKLNNEEKYYVVFYKDVMMPIAKCEIEQLSKIVNDDDWRSAGWLLERTNAQQFGKKRDIANIDEFARFIRKYFGEESEEALMYVWQAIMQGKEERMTYDETEAESVNTRDEGPRAIADKSSSD